MNTLLNKLIASTLALTLVITVGSDAAFAQRGKSFGNMFKGRSSGNGGGGNGSSFNRMKSNNFQSFGNKSFGQSNNNRSFGQSNSNRGNFSFKGFGSNNGSSQKSNGFRGLNTGNLQNLMQNRNKNNGTGGIRLQDLKNNNGLKNLGNNGLQKFGNGGLQNALKNNGGNRILNGNSNLNKLGKFDGKVDFGGKVQNWLNAQKNKNGNGSKLANLILHNHNHGKVCIDHDHWCRTKPKPCHWWYKHCKPLAYCHPQHHVHCHWNYVTCDYIVNGQVVVADARWYLGMKGLLLPGQGVGIEEVTPGSPAAAVGLQPGMIITRCNGIDLVDETVLPQVIAQSGGVLQMDLLLSGTGQPATCVVVMQRVASVNF